MLSKRILALVCVLLFSFISFAEVFLTANIDSVDMVSEIAPHNAFTDLISYRDKLYLTFREANSHVGSVGDIRVLVSNDVGNSWQSAAFLSFGGDIDLRDPHLSITPEERLMLNCFVVPQSSGATYSAVFFSDNGTDWDAGTKIPNSDGYILWAPAWRDGKAYCVAYGRNSIHLFESEDGINYNLTIPQMLLGNSENETSILFSRTGAMILLVRREGPNQSSLIGYSKDGDPYNIQWKDTGVRVGGPKLIELPNGTILVGGRRYQPSVRMSLWLVDIEKGSLSEILEFPSGGDTSYPGMIYTDNKLLASYYSSHIDSRAKIYFSKVSLSSPVLYREIFASNGVINPLSFAGWFLNSGNQGSSAPADQVAAANGANMGIGSVNSNPAVSDNNSGYAYVSSGYDIGRPHLFWTDEYTFDLRKWGNVKFSWYPNNTSANEKIRAAIRVGDPKHNQWYVSDPYIRHIPSGWTTGTVIEIDYALSSWRKLYFKADEVLEMGDISEHPSFTEITAFGVFLDDKQNHCRFDNFKIAESLETAHLIDDGDYRQYSFYQMDGSYNASTGFGDALRDDGPVGNNNLMGLNGVWRAGNAPRHTAGFNNQSDSAFAFAGTNPDIISARLDMPLKEGFKIEFMLKADTPPSVDSLYPHLCTGIGGSAFNLQGQRKNNPERLDGLEFTLGLLATPSINSIDNQGFNDGRWRYISFGYDAGFDRIWLQVDGQVAVNYGVDTFCSPSHLLFGATSSLNARYGFNGIIDDIKISYYSGTKIISPSEGQPVYYGQMSKIAWNSNLNKHRLGIQFSSDGGESWITIFANSKNKGFVAWQPPAVNAERCFIKLYDPKNSKIVYAVSSPFALFEECDFFDITGDCKVDLDDFAILSRHWLIDSSAIRLFP